MTESAPTQPPQAITDALAHHRAGRIDEAERIYRDVLERDSNNFDALHLLGVTAHQRGRRTDAIRLIRRSLEVNPASADAYRHLAEAYRAVGDLEAARGACETSLAIVPGSADAHNTNGGILLALKRPDAAIESFERAIALDPGHAQAHYNLGIVVYEQGDLDRAEKCFRAALEASEDFIQAQLTLAKVHQGQGRDAEALAEFQELLSLDPTLADAQFNLGHMLQVQGFLGDALACFDAALAADPEFAEARWASTISRLALVSESQRDEQQSRDSFGTALEEMDRWFAAERAERGYRAVGTQQPFFLAYYEENNRALLSRYGDICSRLMELWAQRARCAPQTAAPGGVLRIGIVGRHFVNHSVWHAITKGWVKHIDRRRFSLHLFNTGPSEDGETQIAKSCAASYVTGLREIGQWVTAVGDERLDAIIYPEIGMDSLSVQLASLRLAPVQAACWGHPETTGLPTMDYYLSAERFEPVGSTSNYREQLVPLPNLGCCYEPLEIKRVELDLDDYGIGADRPILICAGTPFKYASRHDSIFVDIARRLGECQFVFFDHHRGNLTERLMDRLESAFDEAGLYFGDYSVMMPWLKREEFYALLRRANVYLDTVGFSGFNTVMQALECDLPVVAQDGKFMRGRLGSGILKQLGLTELVARDDSHYVDITVRLASDIRYQDAIRERIRTGRSRLFGDEAPVRSLEAFLLQACRAARPETA